MPPVCHDIDECATNNGNCGSGYTCVNRDGRTGQNHDCVGKFPFSPVLLGLLMPLLCVDVDECMTGTHSCDTHANCSNSPEGSYSCNCSSGYEGNGMQCQDVNECSTANGMPITPSQPHTPIPAAAG